VRITAITAYRLDLPFRDGPYICSGGRSALGFDSLVVRVDSDAGVTGWGEMAPLGAFYDPAFPGGARAAFGELAATLIGEDPTQLVAVERRMDHHMKGHPYAKSAINMACWDLLGKMADRPLAELLGGRFGSQVDLYRSVSQGAPEKMAARAVAYVKEGYRRIQVKVGLDPDEDIQRVEAVRAAVGGDIVLFADANCGWSTHQARRFLRATRQLTNTSSSPAPPTRSAGRCGAIDRPRADNRRRIAGLLQAHADGSLTLTIKIARVGGVTRAKLIRDVAVSSSPRPWRIPAAPISTRRR
jgi:L-alanine-DL-glutamate epimerase-like enolase superfamily enzyme